MLLRWVNYYLKQVGEQTITNLGKDLADSIALLYLLNQLDRVKCPLDALLEDNDLKRAEAMIANSQAFGVADVVAPADILRGNPKVSLIFISEIFRTKQAQEVESQFSHLEEADDEKDNSTPLTNVEIEEFKI